MVADFQSLERRASLFDCPETTIALQCDSPPVLRVRTGTTVVWEWTGNGGGHNVAFDDSDIESDDVSIEQGRTFEHTFDAAGTYRYYCAPHHSLGMRGVIIVEE